MVTIKTSRLILRQWQDSDLVPFAALNADPRVREFFPSLQSREKSDHDVKLVSDHIARCGWGFWAVSLIETNEFIGFIGLEDVYFQAHFTPAVEIGWRLAFDHWGKGYATEGAKAALKYGFETLRLDQIVSFTTMSNMRSRHVMEKIGMHHRTQDDFDHPKLPEGHPLRRHVLYRMSSHDWFSLCQKDQKYVYKPYSATFPDLFKKEKERISSSLTNALAIEHVGSTAIPNLGGKGIIDIAISVPKKEMEHASSILQKLGYQYRPTFSTPERFYFIAYLPDLEEGTRRYHIHLTYSSSKEWKELIGFRDYLRVHPEAVEEYASLKRDAANTAGHDGKQYRKIKEPMFQKINALIQEHHNSPMFYFAHAKPSQKELLCHWFEQKHIKEWMHSVGLQSTLNGLEKFFEGKSDTTYWIGYDKDTPFAFLITSPEGKDATTLDLFICDLNYLGKGIAVSMIKEFLRSHFSHVKRVLIDPEATNTRAIHVYQKIGFKIIGEFIASWHPVPHYQMELFMRDLLPSIGASNA